MNSSKENVGDLAFISSAEEKGVKKIVEGLARIYLKFIIVKFQHFVGPQNHKCRKKFTACHIVLPWIQRRSNLSINY